MKTTLFNHLTSTISVVKSLTAVVLLAACTDSSVLPVVPADSNAQLSGGSRESSQSRSWGPETPNFNLEVILRGEGKAFGHVKFRQPNDDLLVVLLDTWVRDLEPNTAYLLQRAVDTNLDGDCTSNAWLTLGKGLTPQSILTNDAGTGNEELFRSVAAFPVGSTFDIHFRVINQSTGAVVLTSECYQFTISQ